MASNFNRLKLPLQKFIDLGLTDRWLREIADIIPRRAPQIPEIPGAETSDADSLQPGYDFNTHITHYTATIAPEEIREMIGFRKLLQACARSNVKIGIEISPAKVLKVRFDPSTPFSQSIVFGVSYTNVLPMLLH